MNLSNNLFAFLFMLMTTLFLGTGCSHQAVIPPIEVLQQAEQDASSTIQTLQKTMADYFHTSSTVDYTIEFLGPMRKVGVGTPKQAIWIVGRDSNAKIVTEGAAKIAFNEYFETHDGNTFEILNYYTKTELQNDPSLITRTFSVGAAELIRTKKL